MMSKKYRNLVKKYSTGENSVLYLLCIFPFQLVLPVENFYFRLHNYHININKTVSKKN